MKVFVGLAILATAAFVSAQPETPATPPLVTPAHSEPTPAPVTAAPSHAPEGNTTEPAVTQVPTTQHVETSTSRYHSTFKNVVCNFTACVEPSCQCLNDVPPKGLAPEVIPQFITITFDGAVRVTNFPYYRQLYAYKNKANGCPIQATYFVSHVDTNYKLVHDLYRHGNEIGSHSISKTKNNYQDYWKNLQLSEWKAEMGGQRRIISKLADIPIEQIKGARAPNLQTSGNITIEALISEKFEYDCSSPSRLGIKSPFFPYTLDYGGQRGQDCPVGPCVLDDQVYPGFWEVLMNDFNVKYSYKDKNETIQGMRECATAAGCIIFNEDGSPNMDPSAEVIFEMFKDNFNRFYTGNKAPFPLYLSEDWIQNKGKREGLIKFIEWALAEHSDVYFVTIDEVINWMKNSVTATEYAAQAKCKEIQQTKCAMDDKEENLDIQFLHKCIYEKVGELDGQDKTIFICDDVECPAHFPWTHRDV